MEERTSGFKPVKKKKGRFNLVDLLLVIVALAVIFVVVFVMDPFSLNLFGGRRTGDHIGVYHSHQQCGYCVCR